MLRICFFFTSCKSAVMLNIGNYDVMTKTSKLITKPTMQLMKYIPDVLVATAHPLQWYTGKE